MRTDNPPASIRLSDYRPPAYAVEDVELEFDLKPRGTRVAASLTLVRRGPADAPLTLDGIKLTLLSLAVDGRALGDGDYTRDAETLTIPAALLPDACMLTTLVEIDPEANTELSGLYMSGGRFCTQCEAEGFRRITYYPDRPDVLSRFTVRIRADEGLEHLLSNGNLVESGPLDGGRRYAVWRDPFPKPCYLFALVAGSLDVLEGEHPTTGGRRVALRIYVDPGQSARAAYAMDALKRAMAWDEGAFGRQYDLDLFMIVAVRDFNFGAMENKGLNIFNSALLLADPETATDADYERIESVVAHEYFHNWTGNRVTCRDWFQLCLKEGLTVFRDQAFSADQRGAAVQRIKDVRALRARQFPEDAGPLAHPVRPQSYLKIDNFYTATVYEKGSQIVHMLKAWVGESAFRAGMDLYFERCDGTAATVEDFVGAIADASGEDLAAFMGWYAQAGTPELSVTQRYDEDARALELTFAQSTAPTPGQPDKRALPMPIRFGLIDHGGAAIAFQGPGADGPLRFAQGEATVRLNGVAERPVLSVLRGFSAPVSLKTDAPAKDDYTRLAHDPDAFNRWEAGQGLAEALILRRADGLADEVGEERFAEALRSALSDPSVDDGFKALLLAPPGENDLAVAVARRGALADPAALRSAREALRTRLAVHLRAELGALHTTLQDQGEFDPSAGPAGRRALRNAVLDLIAAEPTGAAVQRIEGHFQAAANMTDAMGGLNALMLVGGEPFDRALAAFYDRWRAEPLVIDKWFAVQARAPAPETLGRVMALTTHPAFDARTPNRLRALVATFASANPARFHDPSGAGYRFVADQILRVDAFNPSIAARLVETLGGWKRYIPVLSRQLRAELDRIAAHQGLSRNVLELADKARAV